MESFAPRHQNESGKQAMESLPSDFHLTCTQEQWWKKVVWLGYEKIRMKKVLTYLSSGMESLRVICGIVREQKRAPSPLP